MTTETTTTAKAKSVSMEAFANAYIEVQAAGGNLQTLMDAVGITNEATANQKLVKLRAVYAAKFPDIKMPALARRSRTTNSANGTAAERAAKSLHDAFAKRAEETQKTESDKQDA